MKTLVSTLKLSGNPFEHYTAETEPNITEYAVRPPYLQAISDRVRSLKTFFLFGDRGAGKSATRLTIYNEAWRINPNKNSSSIKSAFVVNLTDFHRLIQAFKKENLQDRDIVKITAFAVIEQMFVWLSSLEADERQVYVEGLDSEERTLIVALIQIFYLNVPEMDREISTGDALRLLNSAWTTKSAVWVTQRWEALSKIVVSLASALSKKQLDVNIDISGPADSLMRSLIGEAPNVSRAILSRLSEFAQAFGFSGVVILVDKVDETIVTSNSAEATAKLIHPLLAQTHLLEVPNFSWVFFLWSNVQDHFTAAYHVRLDKLAHARITWNSVSLREMIETRLKFFSDGKISFADLLMKGLEADRIFADLVATSVSSPREMIKLIDIVFREHDVRGEAAPDLLDADSLIIGQDKYALENINSWFPLKPLQEVLRLGKLVFVNKDVQAAFKMGDQGARVRIKNWEDVGLVRQSGTAPSELGGKQAYRYVVNDARLTRIIDRKLDSVVGAELDEDDTPN